MDVAFLDILIFIISIVPVILVLIGLNRISRKLEQNIIDPSRTWKITNGLVTVGRWMIIASGALIVPLLLTMMLMDATLSIMYFLIVGKLVVTRVLTVAALVVIGTLFWRIILRWGVKGLIQQFHQVIQAKLTEHPPQQTLKFMGQLCFAVCAVILQLLGMACLLVIRGAFTAEPEDDGFLTEGTSYNFATGRFDSGCKAGGRYHDDD